MNKKKLIVSEATLVILFLFNFIFSQLGANDSETQYSVRWTTEVKIKDISGIDSLFDRPVDMSRACKDCSLVLTDEKEESKKVQVITCRQYFDLKNNNFYAYTTYDITMEDWFIFDCNTLNFLKNSIPAKVSYLNDFVLTKEVASYLPSTLVYWSFVGSEKEYKKASSKTLKELGSKLKIRVRDKFNLELEFDDTTNIISLLAWGDFNHDGIEDILLHATHHYMHGSGRAYESFVLTRLEKNGKLIELPLTVK